MTDHLSLFTMWHRRRSTRPDRPRVIETRGGYMPSARQGPPPTKPPPKPSDARFSARPPAPFPGCGDIGRKPPERVEVHIYHHREN